MSFKMVNAIKIPRLHPTSVDQNRTFQDFPYNKIFQDEQKPKLTEIVLNRQYFVQYLHMSLKPTKHLPATSTPFIASTCMNC